MNPHPTLLILGAGMTGSRYLESARALGAECLLIERAQHRKRDYGPLAARLEVPGDLDEDWVEQGLRIAQGRTIDGLIAFSEAQVLAGALIAERLGLRGPGLSAAITSRNKALQRGICAAAGIRQPRFRLVSKVSDARDWVATELEGGPCVVKVLDGAGSVGVEIAEDLAALDRVAQARDGQGKVLVEEYAKGGDFSWEAFLADGVPLVSTVTAKHMSGTAELVEVGHWCGPDVAATVGAAGEALGVQVTQALGMRTGMVHMEFRLSDADEAILIEVAVRKPGARHMQLFKIATGVNAYECGIRLALGLPVTALLRNRRPPRAGATVILTAPPGRVRQIVGREEAAAIPGISDLRVDVGIGDTVRPLRSAYDWLGMVTVDGESPEERDAIVRKFMETFSIVTE